MRVLTVGNIHPPHDLGGGYELDWAAGVAALQAAGHEVRVLASDFIRSGVREPDPPWVARELRWYWKDHEFPHTRLRDRAALERHNRAAMARELRDFAPEVVSWWSMGGMSIALIEQVRRSGVAAVGIVYDDWMVYGPLVDAWQRAWRTPRARSVAWLAAGLTGVPTRVPMGAAARWLFCSDSVRLAAQGAQRGLDDTDLLPPGLNELFLDPAPARSWNWRLLIPGRLDPRKGVVTAIEALPLLPAARLELIGSGEPAFIDDLRRRSENLGVRDRVLFGEPRPRPEVARAYAAADAVLFPVTWAEPFGLVPLEAMGIGRPVVASGRGGSGEYLRDGINCLLHEPGDPASLAAAVERLARDGELRARLRAGGFATAPPYARSRWNGRVVAEHERRAGGA